MYAWMYESRYECVYVYVEGAGKKEVERERERERGRKMVAQREAKKMGKGKMVRER